MCDIVYWHAVHVCFWFGGVRTKHRSGIPKLLYLGTNRGYVMPIELCLTILKAIQSHYKERNLKAELAAEITQKLIPICNDIESGKYDIGGEE